MNSVSYDGERNKPMNRLPNTRTELCYPLQSVLSRTDSIICPSFLLCPKQFIREYPDSAAKWQFDAELSCNFILKNLHSLLSINAKLNRGRGLLQPTRLI